MELFIAPKIPLSEDMKSTLTFLDIDLFEVVNAVLHDIRIVGEDTFPALVEKAISKTHSHWNDPRYSSDDLYNTALEIEKVIKFWLYVTNSFDILVYYYCRTFRNIESLPGDDFSTYYLEVEVLADDNYRRDPTSVRQSLQESRIRFLNR